ncbi:MAG: Uncharacterised protein [Cryomorphaceae bacterium]|nr:MAG: Uncharacterised protein [Cryomorphaceae bacterium]
MPHRKFKHIAILVPAAESVGKTYDSGKYSGFQYLSSIIRES